VLDKFGRPLKAGDKVTIQAEVVALYRTEPIINLKVRLLEPRPTSDGRDCRDCFCIHSKTGPNIVLLGDSAVVPPSVKGDSNSNHDSKKADPNHACKSRRS